MQKSDTKGYLSLKIRLGLPAELGQVLGHLAFVAFLWAKKSHFFFEKVRLVQPEN